jgi:hypothetical protein
MVIAGACNTAAPAPAPRAVTIPLERYFRDLKAVRVQIGSRPLRFLLDTGGGYTLVTPSVARDFGCTPHGREVGHRMTGEAVEFQWCEPLDLQIGTTIKKRRPIAVFGLDALLPEPLPRLDGILALDSFRGDVVTLDWTAGSLTLQPATSAVEARRPIRFATGDSGASLTALLEVPGARGPLWFLLDSGNLRGTLVGNHVLRDGLLAIGPDRRIPLSVGNGRSARFPFATADISYDGVLGTDFLLAGPVTLDLRQTSE